MSARAGTLEAQKIAIRGVLEDLADVAHAAGLYSVARDIRTTRLPKLEDERFSLVVLGEFNHGKSTFINALLGAPVLPVGITPTTAAIAHIQYGASFSVEAVFAGGERRALEPRQLVDWLTVDGQAAAGRSDGAELDHLDIRHPAAFLRDHLTLVDTPGVNDINDQRADITYGYVPRADAAVFLLDATQILTASERQFLEERILRSARDRLVFVITKADLLEPAELAEALAFARRHLGEIVPEPPLFPIAARRALAGDVEGSGMIPLFAHLKAIVGRDRRRLVFDHALADAGRLSGFVRQSLAMRRRTLDLPLPELAERVARAEDRFKAGRHAFDRAAATIRAETTGLKARVRQDLVAFTDEFVQVLPAQIDAATAPDIQRYLGAFVQDTWKSWLEAEGAVVAAELERLAQTVIEVANESAARLTNDVAAELAVGESRVAIGVDGFRYDASIFALGALGTTVFLFVNTLVGGLLTLAVPILAVILRARVAQEIKAEAKRQAPASVRRVAALLAPKLDEIIDGFAARLNDFVAEAGSALARGIAEVLARALDERLKHDATVAGTPVAASIDESERGLKAVDEQIADIRQALWQQTELAPDVGAEG